MSVKKVEVTDAPEKDPKEKTPAEYFEYVKSKKNEITDEELQKVYQNGMDILKKYMITNQLKACEKVIFLLETVKAERKVVEAGFTQFVYRWYMEKYIDVISDKSVGIIELSNYEREIPDEYLDTVIKAKSVFDELYVVFTDYTRKETRKVAKERREKDPILFGAIMKDGAVLDRLYFICDWKDDTCDLTLDKLVSEYTKQYKRDSQLGKINHDILELDTVDKFKDALKNLKQTGSLSIPKTKKSSGTQTVSDYIITEGV